MANGSRLYLFSDGVYEIRKSTGKMMVFREFTGPSLVPGPAQQ